MCGVHLDREQRGQIEWRRSRVAAGSSRPALRASGSVRRRIGPRATRATSPSRAARTEGDALTREAGDVVVDDGESEAAHDGTADSPALTLRRGRDGIETYAVRRSGTSCGSEPAGGRDCVSDELLAEPRERVHAVGLGNTRRELRKSPPPDGRRGTDGRPPRGSLASSSLVRRIRSSGSGAFGSGAVARVGHEVLGESGHFPSRQPRPDEDAVVPVFALVDRSTERVQLCELPTLVVRAGAADGLERSPKRSAIARAALPDPPRSGPKSAESPETVRKPPPTERIDQVDLVQHELDGQLVRRRSRAAPTSTASSSPRAARRARRRRRRAAPGRRRASPRASTRSPRPAMRQRRMKPTVSVPGSACPSCSKPRVVGSSVSKSRSSTDTSAPVRAFRSVDLPTFV